MFALLDEGFNGGYIRTVIRPVWSFIFTVARQHLHLKSFILVEVVICMLISTCGASLGGLFERSVYTCSEQMFRQTLFI